jgi:biofilm PGA synthesis protein PgaA
LLEEGRYDAAQQYVRDRMIRRAEGPVAAPLPEEPPAPAPAPAPPPTSDALFAEGEALEARREYVAAYHVYDRILKEYPGSQAALNLKYRTLINMGSYSLAADMLAETAETIDPELMQQLRGDEAMVRIRWQEPAAALRLIARNLADAGREECGLPEACRAEAVRRARCDRILALRQQEYLEQAAAEYEYVCRTCTGPVSGWVRANAGDTYAVLGKADAALAALAMIGDQDTSDPAYGKTQLLVYNSLVELGRYEDAFTVLGALDREQPVQIFDRGSLRDNLLKEEIARERGMWYAAQDRLGEAQRYFEDLLARAPLNTMTREALAQTYLWRGYPRAALRECEIARTVSRRSLSNEIVYCQALHENGRTGEALALAQELQEQYPRNPQLKQLTRSFAQQGRSDLYADGGFVNEYPGVHETAWSVRYTQPLAPWRAVFGEVIRRTYEQKDLHENLDRGIAGLDWRFSRDWTLTGTLGTDYLHGTETGFSGRLAYAPGDRISVSGFYDSFSLDVPLRARVNGINARQWEATAQYRQSESFLADGKAVLLQMSDGNQQRSYGLVLDTALMTRAVWKTRVALEGFAMTNSRRDPRYFSPATFVSAFVTPVVEHVWSRRGAALLTGRLFAGAGLQKEQDIDRAFVWHTRYEQEYALSARTVLQMNAGYKKQNYSGEDTDVWYFQLAAKRLF